MKFLSLLSLAALVVGSPLPTIEDYAQLLERQSSVSVSAADLDKFKFYSQHSAAAYCNFNTAPGKPVVCKGQCNNVRATVVNSFVGPLTGIGAYVSVDTTRREVVLSIRGSNNVRNFITDVVFVFQKCDLVSQCKVHTGFAEAWKEISGKATAAIQKAMSENPGFKLVTTGHSLGGAIAILGGAYLRAAGFSLDIITYGAPRVGNDHFVNFVTNQPGGEFRVTHLDDPVPRLPPMIFGYRHTSPEFWVSDGSATSENVSLASIKVCQGIANTQCNGGTFGFNIVSHLHYFRDISGCGNPLQFKRDEHQDVIDRLNKWSKADQALAASMNHKRNVDQDLIDRLNRWSQKDQDLSNSL